MVVGRGTMVVYERNRRENVISPFVLKIFFKSILIFHSNIAKTPNTLLYLKRCNFDFSYSMPVFARNLIPHIRYAFCVIRSNTTIKNYSLYIYQAYTIRTAAVCVCVRRSGLKNVRQKKRYFFFVIYFSCYYYIHSRESFTRNTCAL